MFYDRYVQLCKNKGVTPSRAAIEAGISKSLVTKWKTNQAKEPSPEVIRKLSEYFGISKYEVLEAFPEQKEKAPEKTEASVNGDLELTEYLEELKNREECRMLFSLAKGATKEDVMRAVAIIEALRREEESR